MDWIKRIIGTKNDREIKRIRPYVEQINNWENDYQRFTDAELKARTDQFKARVSDATAGLKKELEEAHAEGANAEPDRRDEFKTQIGEIDKQLREKEAEVLEELLPEAFAAVREASRRTIGLRHFDVQLIGGVVLHEGKIAEMKTGEGKTLVATLPLYLNALTGRGVHRARSELSFRPDVYHSGLSLSQFAADWPARSLSRRYYLRH